MPWFRTFLWIGTIFLMIVLGSRMFRLMEMEVATVECFEMSDRMEGERILHEWTTMGAMDTVVNSIKIDFLFMVFYVLLMINCSNHQMNLEPNLVLNNLLRLNIVLAIVLGVLDLAENLILLHNIRSMNEYIPTVVISTFKFAFFGWIVLVWIISLLKKKMRRRAYARSAN